MIILMDLLSLFSKKVLVGHRGHPSKELENTLESVDSAIRAGADLVEVDVQSTRDGVLVLSHDESLERVYDVKINIRESLWDDIKGIKRNGYRLARLEEALDFVKGRVGMFLEIKNPEDTQAVLEAVKIKGASSWVILISFHPEALQRVKGEIITGLVYSKPPGMIPEAKKLGCSLVLPKYTLATQKAIEFAHRLKLKVIAWTVNDIVKARELFERGVDGIATDEIEKLKEARGCVKKLD
ncbi:MAG: glycerophosphodiester phosphodiesterase [Aquificaceae bacterium]